MEEKTVGSCDQFSFPEEKKDNGFLNIANAQRLVIVIQYEHFSIQLPVRYYGMNLRTED